MIGLSISAAVAALANLRVRTYRLPAAAVMLVVIGSFVLSDIAPVLFRQFFVKPSELELEKPYIERNIALTRQAYNLDQIAAKPFAAEQKLTFKTLDANKANNREYQAVGLAALVGYLRAAAGDPHLLSNSIILTSTAIGSMAPTKA